MSPVQAQVRSGVALLTVNAPPVNALSHSVRVALCEALRAAIADESVVAVVLTGANRTFVAGADLSELSAPLASPDIRELFAAVDACPKPVVAALGGMALGGGLELALCCDRRVASPRAAVGLPEVTLGLLPGGGGTQRLPRLIGLEAAAKLILSGRILPAARAAELGLVDEVVQADGDEVEAACELARALGEQGASSLRRLSRQAMPLPGRDPVALLSEARAAASRAAPGRFALEMIVQCLEAAATRPTFEAGMAVEGRCFEQCHAHPQHRALLHLFFAERACAKLPGVPRTAPGQTVRTAALVGDGSHRAGLEAALGKAGVRLVEPGRLDEADVVLETSDVDELDDRGLDGKREALARAEREAGPGTLLVAVGSTLDLDALATAVSRPRDLVGLALPPRPGRVVQVIRGASTSPEAMVLAMRLGKQLGKLAVAVGNAPGLVGERMMVSLRREVEAMVAEGRSRARIHAVLERFGPSLPLRAGVDAGPELAAPGPGRVRPLDDEQALLHRCLQAMAEEGRHLLAEGVASRGSDVDVVCVHGFGFPDVAGGPMFWAEQGQAQPQRSRRAS